MRTSNSVMRCIAVLSIAQVGTIVIWCAMCWHMAIMDICPSHRCSPHDLDVYVSIPVLRYLFVVSILVIRYSYSLFQFLWFVIYSLFLCLFVSYIQVWMYVCGSYHKLVVLRLNYWPDWVSISRDITRHGSNSDCLVYEEDAGSLELYA